MSMLIVNCNHWIGYHIVEMLLNQNYTVDGIVTSRSDQDLSMFFGRNSDFSFVENRSEKTYEACIIVGNYSNIEDIKAKKKFIINTNEKEEVNIKRNHYVIRVPLLFGEWMPMNEQGVYYNDKFVAFDSEEFHKKAIYINVFTEALLQWIKSSTISNFLEVKPSQNDQGKKLENSIYLRDNGPMNKRIMDVQKHYKKYKNFYNGK